MSCPAPLPAEQLHTHCDPASLGFTSTAELPEPELARIHSRAIEAVQVGLAIRHPGYNLFVVGDPGSSRHAIVAQLLEAERANGTAPADWCYVNNFTQPSQPRLMRLPCGRGTRLHEDMQRFVGELAPALAAAFESDEYRRRIESLQEEEKQREDTALRQLGHKASEHGIALLRTPQGFMFAPLKDGEETLSSEEFSKLPETRQQELSGLMEQYHEKLHALMNEFPHWRRELQNQIKAVGQEVLRLAVGHLIEELRPAYADLPEVGAYLDAVMQDIVDTGAAFHESGKGDEEADAPAFSGTLSLQRYRVNPLVTNPADGQRPVVCEDHPTLQNLVGRIEHIVHMGTLVSNFMLIRSGALQRANGGFLVLDALKVLTQPYAWEGLKRALRSGRVRIESLSELIGWTGSVQMEPEPMPLDLKVVLIGDRLTYYLLTEFDAEFPALFRINAEMESEIPRGPDSLRAYAALIAQLGRRAQLRPLDAAAVARIIDQAARLAGDAERLITRTQPLDNLLCEADHCAARDGASQIGPTHVAAALDAQRRRNESLRKRYQEEILRGQLLIDTAGTHIGQANGLAVIPLGAASFAHPVRITATVRMGEGEVVDIEREVELGGPIHSKGVLILSSFLAARFGWAVPLSLKASLVFEQSYGGVEGDSASLAELAALLSALSGIPLRQSLAVTGSVNQFGVVQPVGGINEKIEGFFDICAARGLTGEQGVLIPAANVAHLMLREEVIAAVKAGKFAIWGIRTVDEAMELLTGTPAGEPDAKGELPPDSVNYQVAVQLATLAQMRQDFSRPQRKRRSAKKKTLVPPKPDKPPAGG